MITPFTVLEGSTFANAPSAEKLIARSSDAGDTMNLSLSGVVSAVQATETLALAGDREVQSVNTFDTLGLLSLASAPTGIVTVLRQGTAGVGDIRIDSVPADGQTLQIGLTGYTKTYTYRSPAAASFQFPAQAGNIAQGEYFDFVVGATTHRFWFDIDAAGTGAPANPGTLTEIDIATGDTAATIAAAVEAGMETAITGWTCSVAGDACGLADDTATAVKNVLGNVVLSFADAITGTITYTEHSEGTADAANQVRTGWSATTGAAATIGEVAAYLDGAIDIGGTAGTTHGTGTTAHPDLTPSLSSNLVTVADSLACERRIAWVMTQSDSSMTLRPPDAGTDGQTVASLTSAIQRAISAPMILDDEELTDALLPAGLAPTSDTFLVAGARFSIDVDCEDVASPIGIKYQHSRDALNWIDGATAIANADGNSQRIVPTEICEYVRIVITANANTTATSINIKIVSG